MSALKLYITAKYGAEVYKTTTKVERNEDEKTAKPKIYKLINKVFRTVLIEVFSYTHISSRTPDVSIKIIYYSEIRSRTLQNNNKC